MFLLIKSIFVHPTAEEASIVAGSVFDLRRFKSFKSVKPGDVMTDVDNFNQRRDATVIKVEDGIIHCEVNIDQPRTVKYHQKTGINVLGKAFGHLEW
ncbi:MAG: hypothetical protein ACPGO5_01440 [Patescibacteria group bacterium]